MPEDYVARVKEMHEIGGAGSIGYSNIRSEFDSLCAFKTMLRCLCSYRYDWKREEAEKNILRTHTTAVSARMLYEIANVSHSAFLFLVRAQI